MFQGLEEKRFLLDLALILGAASIGGWIVNLLKMPKVLGQILIGVVLGPTILGWLNGQNELIGIMSEIGVIFLMFLAGLETDINELKSSGKANSLIALGGVMVPLILGTVVPYFLFNQYIPGGIKQHQFLFAFYIGTILTATSVSISVSVLRDINQLGSRQGISILGAAIIDDVIGIILLAAVTGMINPTESGSIIGLIVKMAIFFVFSFFFGVIVSKLITRFAHGSIWSERVIVFAIILCFTLSFLSEVFKVAAITGAYIAGVIFSTTPYHQKVSKRIQVLAYSLFTPIFFVSIGLRVHITEEILKYWGYALVIVIIAILGKIVGCGIGALISGFKLKEALQIGVGMIARAEVTLIIANQGVTRNIITDATFTSIVLLVAVSTLVAPPLLKYLFNEDPSTMVSNIKK
ncbi:MAG: cation:proton antiporter [Epulopiscium sp.]|nr:cation:proton antiporter [Candidatus Epulonipiscium sp.]